ncbi:MAG: helix-turn-helix transcriptional regulator [Paludibacterium sp.]|uniref:helix-turn-helix domain-containing protein n=1 Tax=Paludibacterium sp. TaxID=1917523 RepID=UPI0025F7322D|nr:helix-turn-helix transcriptional regulator [Paludibacterium sp.]MBV8046878.1 helix-turn-helix transcriptional regulator [Paludibacterium sp.]MBV8645785.1 helix-turn-helix transcriptional regulator [Paludibacterium sp.]
MPQVIHSSQNLGAELRNWRRARAMTQSMAAHRIGLAQKAISALETHTGQSSIARLLQVLSALDLELVLRDKRDGSLVGSQDW